MGFYDCRCLVTGLSLHSIGATAVLLRRDAGVYQPIALGIAGRYDRNGALDGIEPDPATDLVLRHFLDRRADGRLGLDIEHLGGDAEFADIEELLRCVERDHHYSYGDFDAGPLTTLDGAEVVFALIAAPVWDAVGAAIVADGDSVPEWTERWRHEAPVAAEIYGDRMAEFAEPVRRLRAVGEFLATNGIVWAPPPETAQRYVVDYGGRHGIPEKRDFLDEAKRDLGHIPALASVFAEYERDLAVQERQEGGLLPASLVGMELVVCAYDSPDARKLIADVQQEYVVRYGGQDETPTDPAEFEPPSGSFLVGYVDGDPVACAGWRGHDGTEPGFRDGDAELKRMYVVAELRGRGLARTLLAAIERNAVDAGRRRMILETGSKQPEAVALYLSAGYVEITKFGHYRDSASSRHLGRELR